MRRLLRVTKHHIVKPVYRATRYMVVVNMELWGRTFWQQWEGLAFDKKLSWILFLNHTIAVVSLIEYLVLKRK